MSVALITGSAGLIGSTAVKFFHDKGFDVLGIDNDMRSYFFGQHSSTSPSVNWLKNNLNNYKHFNLDIRNFVELERIFKDYSDSISLIIHTAAQPSHDWAAKEPITDFEINALSTLYLLELTRKYTPTSTFIFTSTNKVYGDRPNNSYYSGQKDESYKNILIKEEENRYEAYFGDQLASVDETMSIDDSKHSVFGASKVAADIMCQEYGKYFGLNTGIFRGGCLTGPNHASAELHGFLSYLVKCIVHNKPYKIFGYKGKQVRDNIHSHDLVDMFWHFHNNPKKGEVYNAGGGRANSISILEAINKIKIKINSEWSDYEILDDNRIGDHVWYISDLSKFQKDYHSWSIKWDLDRLLDDIINSELK